MSATTLSPEPDPAGTYNVDPCHSSVGFEVRHMGIATVRGAFRRFQGTIDATGDAPVLRGTVEVASIDTGDEQRDGHLNGAGLLRRRAVPGDRFHTTRPSRPGRPDHAGRRDHDQGHLEADRADRRRRRRRHRPVGQRAHRIRGRGRDRSPRVRPEVEPDAAERQPARLQRGQAARQRLGRQGGVRRCASSRSPAAFGLLPQHRAAARGRRARARGRRGRALRRARPAPRLQRGSRHR